MTKNQGYTFIEITTVLIILTLILIFALPTWQSLINKNRASTYINNLLTTINYARNAAIKHGTYVTLCHSADQKFCSGTWSDGQILFVDHNGNRQVDSNDEILRVIAKPKHQASLKWRGFRPNNLRFNPAGLGTDLSGSFVYCPVPGKSQYAGAIIVSRTGRARLSTEEESLHC